MKKVFATKLIAAVAVFAGMGVASAATVYDKHDAKFDFTFEAGMGAFTVDKANFGVGQDWGGATDSDRKTVNWTEYYMKPKIAGAYKVGTSTLYGEWTVLAAKTGHDGDAIGYTADGHDHIDTETALVGWKSGKVFEGLGDDAIELYVGQAPLVIADGFVVGDGAADGNSNVGGKHPAFWFGPHSSFWNTAVLKARTATVNGDAFWFKTDETQANTEGFGLNIEVPISKYGKLGAMYMKLNNSDNENRDGMNVIEARYYGNPLADLTDAPYLNLEYVNQNNTETEGYTVKSYAFAIEAGYSFLKCPTKPTLSYRFSYYRGDQDDTDDYFEGYDPLFQKAFARGWGTWLEGEIMGEYIMVNSNKETHMVMLKANPTDKLAVGAAAYRFYAQRDDFYGERVADRHLADEVNIFADWTVNENLLLSGAIGRAWAGDGLADIGMDNPTSVAEITAVVYF